MPITDRQVDVLRAQLTPTTKGKDELFDQLDSNSDREGYNSLLNAAFLEATDRRFGDKPTAEVVDFVADVRARSEAAASTIDPSAAERLIRYSLGDDVTIDDIDADTNFGLRLSLTMVLVAEEKFDAQEMDAFMGKVRGLAEQVSN